MTSSEVVATFEVPARQGWRCVRCLKTWVPIGDDTRWRRVRAVWTDTVMTRYADVEGWFTCVCGDLSRFRFVLEKETNVNE